MQRGGVGLSGFTIKDIDGAVNGESNQRVAWGVPVEAPRVRFLGMFGGFQRGGHVPDD